MTECEIMSRVNKIEAVAGDDERAHSMEDSLYEDVLRYMATLNHECSRLAVAALKTKEIDFERWCA